MQRFLFTVQYLGTNYSGWQTQTNATGIQQVIEAALGQLCQQPVRIEGSGRTDSGVHARGQRAHADIPIDITPRGMVLGLNNLLPADIRIASAEPVADNFHCRFDASTKTYLYQIWNDSIADVFHAATWAHVPGFLDIERMSQGAESLRGHHDFKSYSVLEPEVSTTWRTIHAIGVVRQGKRIEIHVTADGFLRYMVRRIAGTLLEIGRRLQPVSAAGDALEPHFGSARWTAPAHGLVLENVSYEPVETV